MSTTVQTTTTADDAPLPRLLHGESFHKVEDIPVFVPIKPPSNIRELMRLAQVKAEQDVGKFGPPVAALALERPEGHASPELRKYEVLFGRDSLRVGIDLLPMYPHLLKATIIALAELQGIETYDPREEEPGRILHEYRTDDDPIAQELTRSRGWEWPYYGTVDATPQFMHAIYLYAERAPEGYAIFDETYIGLDEERHTIGDAYQKALAWIEFRLGQNSEGLLEYHSPLPKGIENQVWRDSWDSYCHEDGTLANQKAGIASTEVQQLVYDAFVEASHVFTTHFKDADRAKELRHNAREMRRKIIEHFWCEEKGGYFVLGTDRDIDGNLRQLKVRTSNMGHLLHSTLLEGEAQRRYLEATIVQLFTPEMLCAGGIRTLASDEVRFRPGAYHCGSVWLWDTFYCADGLRYHGYYGLASLLADKIHMVINVTQKFPEYVRGDDRPIPTLNTRVVDVWDDNARRINRIEQPPQEVQAWSVAADLAREYYSGRTPKKALDIKASRLEKAILASLEITV